MSLPIVSPLRQWRWIMKSLIDLHQRDMTTWHHIFKCKKKIGRSQACNESPTSISLRGYFPTSFRCSPTCHCTLCNTFVLAAGRKGIACGEEEQILTRLIKAELHVGLETYARSRISHSRRAGHAKCRLMLVKVTLSGKGQAESQLFLSWGPVGINAKDQR